MEHLERREGFLVRKLVTIEEASNMQIVQYILRDTVAFTQYINQSVYYVYKDNINIHSRFFILFFKICILRMILDPDRDRTFQVEDTELINTRTAYTSVY